MRQLMKTKIPRPITMHEAAAYSNGNIKNNATKMRVMPKSYEIANG